jgi:hypothetical protein
MPNWFSRRTSLRAPSVLNSDYRPGFVQAAASLRNPTFTRHHRCAEASVDVVSASRFLSMGSAVVRSMYLRQTQFLVNHLRSPGVTQSNEPEGELRARILSGKGGQRNQYI